MAGYETPEEMQKVIQKWIDIMKEDAEISKKCEGISCSMQYEMTDIDFIFYTNFMDGKVDGGIGPAEPEAMVVLEMSSATFDGMMTGEVDGASAAMSGEMTFSGDVNAAMGLQALQEDLQRLYEQAIA